MGARLTDSTTRDPVSTMDEKTLADNVKKITDAAGLDAKVAVESTRHGKAIKVTLYGKKVDKKIQSLQRDAVLSPDVHWDTPLLSVALGLLHQ